MTNDINFLFIHIPKTGGTSVRFALESIGQNNWVRDASKIWHDTILELKEMNRTSNAISFAVVRNPYVRTYSYYRHFQRVNNIICSFEDFLFFVEHKVFFPYTPMIQYDQTHYVSDEMGNVIVDKIFKSENMQELKNFINLPIENENVGNYATEEMIDAYNQFTIDKVQKLYSRDFRFFNYELQTPW